MTQTADPFFDRALLAVLPVFAGNLLSPVDRTESDIARAAAAAVAMAEQAVLQRRARNTALMESRQNRNAATVNPEIALARSSALERVLARAKQQWPHMRDEYEVQRMREQIGPRNEHELLHYLLLTDQDFRDKVTRVCGEAII